MKGTGHYIGKDGSILVKPVELSGDYEAVVVISEDARPESTHSALKHLTAVAGTRTTPLNGNGIYCPKCGRAHDVRGHLRAKNSHIIVTCECNYQMRVVSEPVLRFFGPRIKVY